MKYSKINKSLFIDNRKKFFEKMKPNSVAFFNSNDLYPVSADTTLPFEQHRDLFYLSGIDQEESVLMLFKSDGNSNNQEILFLIKPNETLTHWEGEKLNEKKAFDFSGIENIKWLNDIEKIVKKTLPSVENFYINTNEHYRAKVVTETREAKFNQLIQNKVPNKNM